MTSEEWIGFVLFTIGLNVLFQIIAWNIGVSIGKKSEEKKNETEDKNEK